MRVRRHSGEERSSRFKGVVGAQISSRSSKYAVPASPKDSTRLHRVPHSSAILNPPPHPSSASFQIPQLLTFDKTTIL